MMDVVALGELLIDFTPVGKSENGNVLFERNPGGAPANVLAALAKLGKRTAFIGKVGDDQFGRFLSGVLEGIGIDTAGMVYSREINTTLAFVHLNEEGDRSFSFYRKPGADMMLEERELNMPLVEQATVFHFGSISMTHEPAKSATLKAVKHAKENGVLVSFDPNLRPALWNDLEEARKTIREGMRYADIVKISEEELEFITGITDLEQGSKILYDQFETQLIFITLGSKGCYYRAGNQTGQKSGYTVKTTDTTGAGDAFLGGALFQIIESRQAIAHLSMDDIGIIVSFANAVGALATTKKGAIPAMPVMEEVEALMKLGIGRKHT